MVQVVTLSHKCTTFIKNSYCGIMFKTNNIFIFSLNPSPPQKKEDKNNNQYKYVIKYLLVCDTVPGTVVEACWLTGPWTSPPLALEGANSMGPSQTSPHWLVCQNSKRDWKVKLIPINYSKNITIAVFHNAFKNETFKTVNNFMTLHYTAVCCCNSIYIDER